MKKFLCLVLVGIFSFQSHSAWAQPKDRCPEKVLDSGKFEGIFVDVVCGDFCHATFILDNGESSDLLCGEEDAEKFFGVKGNRVSVDYELLQYWEQVDGAPGGDCLRSELVKGGRIIAVGVGLDIVKKEEERMAKEAAEEN